MDLNTLANLAEIIGVIIVVGGFAFAVIQILQFRQQRLDAAAIELARSFEKPEFARALRLILSLPARCCAADLRERGEDHEDAALLVSLTLESVGIMVHRRIVSFDLVWELMGGVVLSSWDRLEDWARERRREQSQIKFDEWIEWLAARFKQYKVDAGSRPAYQQYESWEP
jgi:hypothetical protein